MSRIMHDASFSLNLTLCVIASNKSPPFQQQQQQQQK
jgi:hypothetical protein